MGEGSGLCSTRLTRSHSSPSWARSFCLHLGGDSETRHRRPRESGEEYYEKRKQIEQVQSQVTPKSLLPTLVTPWARRLCYGDRELGRSLGIRTSCPGSRPQFPPEAPSTPDFSPAVSLGPSPAPGRVYHMAETWGTDVQGPNEAKLTIETLCLGP